MDIPHSASGFDADTLVTLSDNVNVPISIIEEMSKDKYRPKQFQVISYDEKSKIFVPNSVVFSSKIPVTDKYKILRITCEARSSKGTYIISVISTGNRLFQTSNRKTAAELLEVGEMLVGQFNSNESLLRITNIKPATLGTHFIYNIVVADNNNFLVGGKNSILTVGGC